MTQTSSRFRSLLACAVALALLPAAVIAETSLAVFSPKDGLADGWKTSAWNGPVVEEIPAAEKGTTLLQVNLGGDAKAFGGVVLSASSGSGFALTEEAFATGVVILNLKSGKAPQGEAAATVQPLQIGLTFLNKAGETVHAGFNTQVSVAPSATGSQQVKIPFGQAIVGLKATSDQLASISAIRFQFVGEPLAGFVIVDCTIKSE